MNVNLFELCLQKLFSCLDRIIVARVSLQKDYRPEDYDDLSFIFANELAESAVQHGKLVLGLLMSYK